MLQIQSRLPFCRFISSLSFLPIQSFTSLYWLNWPWLFFSSSCIFFSWLSLNLVWALALVVLLLLFLLLFNSFSKNRCYGVSLIYLFIWHTHTFIELLWTHRKFDLSSTCSSFHCVESCVWCGSVNFFRFYLIDSSSAVNRQSLQTWKSVLIILSWCFSLFEKCSVRRSLKWNLLWKKTSGFWCFCWNIWV